MIMKSGKSILAGSLALMLLALTGAPAWADDDDGPVASAEIDVFSQYIWRGYALSDTVCIIQPSAGVSYKGVSFGFWSNIDTNVKGAAAGQTAKMNETDITIAYDTSFDIVTAGVGFIYYAVDSAIDSQEFYLSLGADVITAPTVTVYREIAYLPAWYLHFGLSHSFEVTDDVSFDLGGSLAYFIPDNAMDALADGSVSGALNVPFLDYFTGSIIVGYTFPLSVAGRNYLRGGSADGRSAHVYMGGAVAMEF